MKEYFGRIHFVMLDSTRRLSALEARSFAARVEGSGQSWLLTGKFHCTLPPHVEKNKVTNQSK